MSGTIFISYRRGEDAGFAGRLFDRLERAFRRKALFMDVDSIPLGQDFPSILEARVAECEVLLALIGRGWLTATDAAGRRRLDSPDDFVRIEIVSALTQGKRVIPVLIDDVRMPRSEDLPEELKPLVRRQATRLSHDRFKADSDRLIRAIKQVLAEAESVGSPKPPPQPPEAAAAVRSAEQAATSLSAKPTSAVTGSGPPETNKEWLESTATSAFKTRNVVLVHGAFDRSSWNGVVERLQAAGLQVVAVQIPLTSLADDVKATKRVIAMQDGPTVLVGHSYGGVVISEVGVDPKVTGLVYVAALAPEPGEDVGELAKQFPTSPAAASIRATDGFAQLDEKYFIENFAPDVPPAQARVLAVSQGPFEQTLFSQKTTVAAWKEKPSWYAVSTMDRVFDPGLERFFAERMKAHTVEVAASHASPVSQPSAIAELIKLAARA